MVETIGGRTDNLLRARQALSQLSYVPPKMVGLDGFEPSTSRLSGVRSNHLSYKPYKVLSFVKTEPSKLNKD